jgi:signal transduction histidine kinase
MFGDEAAASHLSEMGQIVENIDRSVDFLAWELRPALLDSVGLPMAMDNYIRQWSSHSGVDAEFRSTVKVKTRFPPKVETNLYRIMQEALNNIHKHAGARSVQITLESRGDETVLVISDDGKGFNVRNKTKRSSGLGLTGMKERAALIGADLEIESSPRRGTTIYVKVPMTPKRRRKALPAQADTNWATEPTNDSPKPA